MISLNDDFGCCFARPDPVVPFYVWVAHATKNSDKPKQRVIGACTATNVVESERDNYGAAIDPAIVAARYFERFENKKLKDSEYPETPRDVRLVSAPQHGRISARDGQTTLRYFAKAGFAGLDKYEFEVMVLGQPVRVVEYMHVDKNFADDTPLSRYCKKVEWKISQSGEPDALTGDLPAWQRSADLSALIANAQQTLTGFTDLPGIRDIGVRSCKATYFIVNEVNFPHNTAKLARPIRLELPGALYCHQRH